MARALIVCLHDCLVEWLNGCIVVLLQSIARGPDVPRFFTKNLERCPGQGLTLSALAILIGVSFAIGDYP
jgi:hypothetical protein